MDLVVELEHAPEFCPHSNSAVRQVFEDMIRTGSLEALAQSVGVEIVFTGIVGPVTRPTWSQWVATSRPCRNATVQDASSTQIWEVEEICR